MSRQRLVRPARPTTRAQTRLVALVVAITTTVVTVLPALASQAAERDLRDRFTRATVTARTLNVVVGPAGDDLGARGMLPEADALEARVPLVEEVLGPARQVLGHAAVVAGVPDPLPLGPTVPGSSRQATLALGGDLLQSVTWVAGGPPGQVPPPGATPSAATGTTDATTSTVVTPGGSTPPAAEPASPAPELPVALPAAAAHAWGIHVGQQLTLTARETTLRVRVSGIFTPADPTADRWDGRPELQQVIRAADAQGGAAATTGLLLDRSAYPWLRQLPGLPGLLVVEHRWPVEIARVRPQTLPALARGIGALPADEVVSRGAQVRTGILLVPQQWRAGAQVVETITATVVVGLLVLAAALTLLLARLRADRRVEQDRLLRARGASAGQLATLAALDTVGPVLTGALLGHLTACLVARAPCPPWPALAVAAAAVGLCAAAALAGLRTEASLLDHGRRRRVAPVARIVPPLALAALTVLAVLAVRARPAQRPPLETRTLLDPRTAARLTDTSVAVDPLVQLLPTLLAVCAALLLVVGVRLLARAGAAAAGRRRGTGSWLGLTLLSRGAGLTRLPLVAIVVAAGLAVLLATFGHSFVLAGEQHVWRQTGADARLRAPQITPGMVHEVRARGAVTAALGRRGADLVSAPGRTVTSGTRTAIDLVTGELSELRAVRAGTPVALDGPGTRALTVAGATDGVTIHVSRDLPVLHREALHVALGSQLVPVRSVTVDPGLDEDGGRAVVLVPPSVTRTLVGRPELTTELLIRAAPDALARVAAGPGSTGELTLREAQARRVADGALVRHVLLLLALVGAAAALLAGLATHALATATAAARRRLLARARVLGLPAGGRRAVALAQVLPPGLAAVVVGLGAGLGTPLLAPRLLDLGAPYDAPAQPPLHPWWPAVAATAVLLTAVVVLVVVADLRRAGHADLTRHLRSGDQS